MTVIRGIRPLWLCNSADIAFSLRVVLGFLYPASRFGFRSLANL